VPCDELHLIAEPIEFLDGGVEVGRDADALEFFVQDRDCKDAVFVEQVFRHRFRIGGVDVHVSDRARLIWIERRVEPDLGHVFEPVHPVTGEVAQPRFLAFAADAVVKKERFADGELWRG